MTAIGETRSGPWSAAVWASGFRPFYLAGAAYGILALALWPVLDATGPRWHGHEMIFGFVGAISGGFLLTAVPSWARTPEVAGRPLAVLLALWLVGRLAMLTEGWLSPVVVAGLDIAFYPALAAALAPGVLAAVDRRYRLALPVVAGFAVGNLAFHLGRLADDTALLELGLGIGLYSLMILYSFIAGFLTPIFTKTALQLADPKARLPFDPRLEVLAPLTLLLLALCDLGGLPGEAVAGAALVAALVHGLRMARWRGISVAGQPLLLAMNVSYLWLIAALLLLAVAAGLGLPWRPAALHAFTIGALGLVKLSLMTRVVLKHTGRPLRVAPAMAAGYAAMFLAALLRVVAGEGPGGDGLLLAAALLWIAPFAVYLGLYGRYLLMPSLPRG